jgi:hypothetical protein
MGRLFSMGAVEPGNTDLFLLPLRHQADHKWERDAVLHGILDLNHQPVVDRNDEKIGFKFFMQTQINPRQLKFSSRP